MSAETNTLTLRKVLEVRRRQLGPEHPDTLQSMSALAGWLRDIWELEEATSLYREVVAMQRKVLGHEHPDVARSMVGLGTSLHYTEHDEEAEENFRGALAIQRKQFGNQHPNVAFTLLCLGQLLHENDRLDEAERLLRDSVAIYQDRAGEGHLYSSHALSWLGRVLLKKGELTEAEGWLRKGLQTSGNGRDRVTAVMRGKLAECLVRMENYAEAEELLLSNYKTLKKHKDQAEWLIHETVRRLVALYTAWRKPEKAAPWQAKLPGESPTAASREPAADSTH